MRILFLGASKRTSLVERFLKVDSDIECFFVEEGENHAVESLGTVLHGPKFNSQEFLVYLDSIIDSLEIDIVIPCLDSSVLGLATYKALDNESRAYCVVSELSLCKICDDKTGCDDFFVDQTTILSKIPRYGELGFSFPCIAKPKIGSGASGHKIFQDKREFGNWKGSRDDYVIQKLITGVEISVDAFFFYTDEGCRYTYYVRSRDVVEHGEVMKCSTYLLSDELRICIETALERMIGFARGPLNMQIIVEVGEQDDVYFVEVNPRFGGGVTMAIEAGINMPEYIIKTRKNQEFNMTSPKDTNKNLVMSRSRRDHFYNEPPF